MEKNKLRQTICALVVVTFITGSLFSCNGISEEVQREQDSLRFASQTQQAELDELSFFLSEISLIVDSISMQDKYLILKNNDGKRFDKQELRESISNFCEILSRQRSQITVLTDSVLQKSNQLSKLSNLVNFLSSQLDEKEQEIFQLKAEIDKKIFNIGQLNTKVASLNKNLEELREVKEIQDNALSIQAELINECYVKIGTKDELREAGLLEGGLFQKKRLNVNKLSSDYFSKIDIRQFSEISLDGRRVKILTQMPEDSYRLTRTGSQTTLTVLDPTKFWSISNYLVIQID